MEEEGGSAVTELSMWNCGKLSAVQMSTTEKKYKIKVQRCNVLK